LIKGHLAPLISPEFYSRIDRWGPSIVLSEPGGLEFEPRPQYVTISTFISHGENANQFYHKASSLFK
jgi:hypothetical protein